LRDVHCLVVGSSRHVCKPAAKVTGWNKKGTFMKNKLLLSLAPVAALCVAAMGMPSAAAAGTDYQATLNSLNHSSGSGSLSLSLNGNVATITEKVSGVAATFSKAPFPHVQHIHGGAMGTCPTMAADKNADGVVSTTEGAPSYGPILTTLHKSGDTSPAAGTNIKTAPSGASYNYSRTITLSAASVAAIKGGTAVIVVHGLDPSTLSKKAQAEKSELVPSLPLAATSPTLCGKLVVSQMSSVPGGVNTGGGSTSGIQDENLYILSGGLLLAAGATMVARRRLSRER